MFISLDDRYAWRNTYNKNDISHITLNGEGIYAITADDERGYVDVWEYTLTNQNEVTVIEARPHRLWGTVVIHRYLESHELDALRYQLPVAQLPNGYLY